ncbi:hypothetical protein [Nitrosopumilus ureiphilus]|uniref:Uncharacterized protein n=1 Tax=Nitrosopumilus ureiphilus TaxID=1470067 RepID=A0A7D5M8J5_9ARCH|nr:hypothetical protein [Nitrosopumilus ureiphilus]QLH07667.1 hypothetical protein C5F50_11745 [Nitrosopumilus ureiphilus]
MPIEFKRESNACEKCKKLDTEVGKITHYTKHGTNLLLCAECIKKREKPYTEICPKCKRLAHKHGGLTFYSDSDSDADADADEPDDIIISDSDSFDDFYDLSKEKSPLFSELICLECHEKKVSKVKKNRKIKREIKNFAKDHWKFWIGTTITIILGIIGLSRL